MFIENCEQWLEERHGGARAFLTPSCTSALEMAVMLLEIGPGDEVLMPSFGFASCPNSVILRGARALFVDIELDTLCMNGGEGISMPIHYAGVNPPGTFSGRMIQDAAHCIGNEEFHIVGDFACLSFHETKNISCGQGGALIVRDEEMVEKAQILRHCGTTKAVSKHAWDWVALGTQQLMSEVLAEYLWTQLQKADEITRQRRFVWNVYREKIRASEKASRIGNGHIFWFLARQRERIQNALAAKGVSLASHYTPLHNRLPGKRYGRSGECPNSIRVAEEILRPPMNVTPEEAKRISTLINQELP